MFRFAFAVVTTLALLVILTWEQRAVTSAPPSAYMDAVPLISGSDTQPRDHGESPVATEFLAVASHPSVLPERIARLLPSLRGAALPDGLHADDDGNLIADRRLKLLFDFLLAGRVDADEATLDDIMLNLVGTLPDAAAEQALQHWNHYQQYQRSIRALAQLAPVDQPGAMLGAPQLEQIELLLARRLQLQQEYLGDLAHDWFAEENAYDARMLILARQTPASTEQTVGAALPMPTAMQQQYETERDLVLQAGLAPEDKARLVDQLRQDHFPGRQQSVRQALRDLGNRGD